MSEMNLMIPDEASVPAYARNPELARKANEEAAANISTGAPPRIKLNGKQFALVDGNGEEKMVPLKSLVEVEDNIYLPCIILRAKRALTKQFFLTKYNPNEEGKAPDCWSNDAERPDPSVKVPQCDTCAACPNNAFGSGTDASGNATNGKACSDSKILAVFVPKHNIHMLRLPPASLKNFGIFVKQLSAKGIPIGNITTLLGFDPASSYPILTFRFGGFVPEQAVGKLAELAQSPEAEEIIAGMSSSASAPALPPPVKEDAAAAARKQARSELTEGVKPAAPPIEDDPLGLGLTGAAAPEEKAAPKAPPADKPASGVPSDEELAATLGL